MWIAAARLVLWPPAAEAWNEQRSHCMTALGCFGAMAGFWLVVPDPAVSVCWMLLAITVIELDSKERRAGFRWIALGVITICYLRAIGWDLNDEVVWHGISHRLISVPVVIAALYSAQFISKPSGSRRSPLLYSTMAAFLLSALLYCGVSGENTTRSRGDCRVWASSRPDSRCAKEFSVCKAWHCF